METSFQKQLDPKLSSRQRLFGIISAFQILLFFVVLLGGALVLELSSRYCFMTSLENLKIGTSNIADEKIGFFDDRLLSTGIPIAELDHYLVGFTWRLNGTDEFRGSDLKKTGVPEVRTEKWIAVRWPSLIFVYKARLSIDYRDRVSKVET